MPHIRVRARFSLLLLAALVCAACGRNADPAPSAAVAPPESAAAPAAPPPRDPGKASVRPRIVALGDSLTAGYGLLERQSYPALLQDRLQEEGYNFEVVNAGVSGDTSAAGLQRLDWALDGNVRVLIVELGANDGLRGLPPDQMRKNLEAIVTRARDRGISVLLLGMEAPPNFGPEYARSFRQVYRDVARDHHVAFVPFMLDKVAGQAALNQGDGIHPNVEGTRIVSETIWAALKPLVDAVSAS